MRYSIWTALALLTACHGRPKHTRAHDPAPGDSMTIARLFALQRDSTDSVLRAPRVIEHPSVVVFWLKAADTLAKDDRSEAFDDLGAYTAEVASLLATNEIQLIATRSETLYVTSPNDTRRTVLLSGLDYPFGYVLVEPGAPERILTGIYSDEELADELRVYFDLSDDSVPSTPRPTT
jgi:hypothetical protein